MDQPNRNHPCHCGSGKRFKHCCGAFANASSASAKRPLSVAPRPLENLMNQALAAHRAGDLVAAETCYREALTIDPRNFDALHMLGVVCLEGGRAADACTLMLKAWPLRTIGYLPFFQNVGLALAAVAAKFSKTGPVVAKEDSPAHESFYRRSSLPKLAGDSPKVSIVAPCRNHERYVGEAIASVARQTHQNIELIIIDDGSQDHSVNAIEGALQDFPFPRKFLYRENRGAHATINEGVSLASGNFIGILNTDDLYEPDRVDFLVRAILSAKTRWAFSNLTYIDSAGQQILFGELPRVDLLMRRNDDLYECQEIGTMLALHNVAVSTGNLFFERTLWEEIGGFEPYRYNHDWAFCLSAILISQPAYLDEPAYRYRLHDNNTISESSEQARREADEILGAWHRRLAASSSPFAKKLLDDRESQRQLDLGSMASGMGHLLDPAKLLQYAAGLGFALPLE